MRLLTLVLTGISWFFQCAKSCRFRKSRNAAATCILCGFLLGILNILLVKYFSDRYDSPTDILDLQSIKDQAEQDCIHPSLSLWTPELRELLAEQPTSLICKKKKNWVHVSNGFFRISSEAVAKYGSIFCDYSPILRGSDDFTIVTSTRFLSIKDGDQLTTDFFVVNCSSSSGISYTNKHSGISIKKSALRRSETIKYQRNTNQSLGLDVLIFGFDSVSRMSWMRNLPKSHLFFTESLGGVVLEGYNIVGDATTQALLPILTGHKETELPEARRGYRGATTVDRFPWIWNDFKNIGYITQYAEDRPEVGTFQMRLLGFQEQPVDHYMRTFFMAVEKELRSFYCLKGSNSVHLEIMNYMREFVHVYKTASKFSFVFSSLAHGSFKTLSLGDEDLLQLIKHLNNSGHLDNALFILMADHGARFNELRKTAQGRLEERNPYVGIRLPPKFIKQYPEAYRNLKTNVHRLSTPFDLHATFREIINFTGTEIGNLDERGISLFKAIPKRRTCWNADIEPHWCSCLYWKPLPVNDVLVKRGSEEIVAKFNNVTHNHRDKCAKLSIKKVISAVKFSINDDVLRFRESIDYYQRVPDLSDNKRPSVILYLITLVTQPGEGIFEATASYRPYTDNFVIGSKSVSRINKYENQAHCIEKNFPHLREFCSCSVE